MSYIRSINNPESLYIWASETHAFIMQGSEDKGYIPVKIFDGLIKKYNERLNCNCRFKSASISEVFVIEDGNEVITLDELDEMGGEYIIKGDFKMQLKYKDVNVIMWGVTWDYIANRK